MYNKFINQLENTGSYNGDTPEYKLLRLGDEYNEIIDNNEQNEEFDELLCKLDEEILGLFLTTRTRYEEKFKGIHVSDVENYDSISKLGLKVPNNNNTPNLGKGIYAIRNMNYHEYISKEKFGFDGHTHLLEWVLDMNNAYSWTDEEYEENMDNTMVCVVEFEYTGYYDECIFGDDHTGFIVIKEDIPPTNIKVKKMSLTEYKLKY